MRINAVVAGLDADIDFQQVEDAVGFLNKVEFKFQVEHVVPLGEIPLATVVATDRPQLHFVITMGFEATVDGLEGLAPGRCKSGCESRQDEDKNQCPADPGKAPNADEVR